MPPLPRAKRSAYGPRRGTGGRAEGGEWAARESGRGQEGGEGGSRLRRGPRVWGQGERGNGDEARPVLLLVGDVPLANLESVALASLFRGDGRERRVARLLHVARGLRSIDEGNRHRARQLRQEVRALREGLGGRNNPGDGPGGRARPPEQAQAFAGFYVAGEPIDSNNGALRLAPLADREGEGHGR